MPENNQDSRDDIQPIIDFHQLELQMQLDDKSSESEEDVVSDKCQLWTNWHFFIVPARIREMQSRIQKEDDSQDAEDSNDSYDRYIPKTKTGRQIGVMNYILHEEGNVNIEEMLYIDVVLRRINSFSPQMAGVDRYDDMGARQFRHDFSRFANDFFSLSVKKRKEVLAGFEEVGVFSPEILQSAKRLENLADIRMRKKTPENSSAQEGKSAQSWPARLSGRDLELFKLLSGMETMSPRGQALSVLNYILPEESSFPKKDASESSKDAAPEEQSDPIRLEPGDKKRIALLLKRFPCLVNRYPYLLRMVERDIPAEKFNASSDEREYKYNDFVPFSLSFPSVLEDSPNETTEQSGSANRFVKWGVIVAVICSLIKLAGILFNALIK